MKQNVIISNGNLKILGQVLSIPNVHLIDYVDEGANGVVLKGKHAYLNRKVAVKIWLKHLKNDSRNKFEQGILEARKTDQIKSGDVVRIYDAGNIGGHFYSVMEFVNGITCRDWLKMRESTLRSRISLAHGVTDAVFTFVFDDILHGDLHTNNILVLQPIQFDSIPNYRIVDFGTSYFSGKEFSAERHWRIFHETFKEILNPLDIDLLWGHKFLHSEFIMDLCKWYMTFLTEIEAMIRSFGIDFIADPYDSSKWSRHPLNPVSDYSDQVTRDVLNKLYKDGQLVLEPQKIGVIHID